MFDPATKRRVVHTNRVAGTYLLSPYQGSSERLTSRVKIRCKRASKDFENLNIFPVSKQWILAGP